MKKRWYDTDPTLSMAVSLLQNSRPDHRERTTLYFNTLLQEKYPGITDCIKHKPGGLWPFSQRRGNMDDKFWMMLEQLRFLSEEDRKTTAIEMIKYIYCLENDELLLDIDSTESMKVVV